MEQMLMLIYNLCMTRRHEYMPRVIHTCYSYGSFSDVVKLINPTRFILESITKLIL